MDNILDKLNKVWLTPLIAIITSALTTYFTFKNNFYDSEIKKVAIELQRQDGQLKKEEFENNIKIKVFEEIKEAIVKRDTQLQAACISFATYMIEDTVFQNALLKSLRAQATPNVQKKVDSLFASQAQSESISSKKDESENKVNKNANKFDVDIFYCEETQASSKPRAEMAKKALDELKLFNVNVRKLPTLTNARPSYQISSNVIRYNETNDAKDETKFAETIKTTIKKNPSIGDISTHAISKQTEWTISVFIY